MTIKTEVFSKFSSFSFNFNHANDEAPDFFGAFFMNLIRGNDMNSPELKLYKFDSCPFCVRVMQKVDSLGIKVEMHDVMTNPDDLRFHMEKTGRKTVPCLYINGEPKFESSDIITWLEENVANLEKSN